ncbi:MAG: CinA family nicotinamide mononucleotide deamidase-related protein, partial [Nitrospira sp.]|nr:CinA family nicotinamide mononucleotide deamidase-related protein [Nitrospira sp.]
MRRGEIIAVGSELLLGGRPDTNSLFLTEGLAAVGVEVRYKSVVGDEKADIVAALQVAARRADVVVLTGGLGPTTDDRTREAVAHAIGRPLRRRAEALEWMRRRLAAWGRRLTKAQGRQGLIPVGAEALSNPIGSAPGFYLRWKGAVIAALPGVPSEAEAMFSTALAPRLQAPAAAHGRGVGSGRIDRRVLHTVGLFESELDQRLQRLVTGNRGLKIGFLPSPLGVTISLTLCGAESNKAMDKLVGRVRRLIGASLYAEGAETMEDVVGQALSQRGLCLALAESCTGGLVGHRLTQVSGSSAYLDRVTVCYSNRAKTEWLGVSERLLREHGAVSAQVAAAMAKGIRIKSRVDIGLSVTGIAGPGGG